MPKTEYVFLQGKVKWFRATTPNEWGKWSHQLYPNEESLIKIRELQTPSDTGKTTGIKNVLRKDEDGYFLSLSRPTSKTIKGRLQAFNPPEVLEADGKTPLRTALVGNGSDVTTKCEVYSHSTPGGGRARAIRWLSSRIDNLIPYAPSDFTTGEAKDIEGLEEQPIQF